MIDEIFKIGIHLHFYSKVLEMWGPVPKPSVTFSRKAKTAHLFMFKKKIYFNMIRLVFFLYD